MDSEQWPETTNRFIGFIDIMGFKDMVNRLDHDEILGKLKSISNDVDLLDFMFKSTAAVQRHTKLVTFSDSFLIVSESDNVQSAREFISYVQYLCARLFATELPFKGAISFGKFTFNTEKSIFFGRPLIDAFLLHEDLLLYSIALDGSAQNKLIQKLDKMFWWHSVINYDTPFKGTKSKHYLIKPEVGNEAEYNGLKTIMNRFRINTSGPVRRYIDNTEEFIDFAFKETKADQERRASNSKNKQNLPN